MKTQRNMISTNIITKIVNIITVINPWMDICILNMLFKSDCVKTVTWWGHDLN